MRQWLIPIAMFLFSLPYLIPAEYMFKVHGMTLLQKSGVVLVDKSALLDQTEVVSSRALIEVERGRRTAVCSGTSTWRYKAGRSLVELPLDRFTSTPDCQSKLIDGHAYILLWKYEARWLWYSWKHEVETIPFEAGASPQLQLTR